MKQANYTSKKAFISIGTVCICYLLLMAALPLLLDVYLGVPLATHWITSTYRVAIPFVFVVLLAFFIWFYDLHLAWFGASFVGTTGLVAAYAMMIVHPAFSNIFEFGLKNSYVYVLAILSIFAWQSHRKTAAIVGALIFALIALMMPISLLLGATSFVAFQTFYLKNWPAIISAALMFAYLCFTGSRTK